MVLSWRGRSARWSQLNGAIVVDAGRSGFTAAVGMHRVLSDGISADLANSRANRQIVEGGAGVRTISRASITPSPSMIAQLIQSRIGFRTKGGLRNASNKTFRLREVSKRTAGLRNIGSQRAT